MPDRASRTGYQPISQNVDDEADVGLLGAGGRPHQPTISTRGLGRAGRPGSIDLKKLDNAFKRYGICEGELVGVLMCCARKVDGVNCAEGEAKA